MNRNPLWWLLVGAVGLAMWALLADGLHAVVK